MPHLGFLLVCSANDCLQEKEHNYFYSSFCKYPQVFRWILVCFVAWSYYKRYWSNKALSVTFLLGGWSNPGRAYPEMFWSFPLRDIWKPSRHGPGPSGPVWAGGLDQMTTRISFQPHPFWDYSVSWDLICWIGTNSVSVLCDYWKKKKLSNLVFVWQDNSLLREGSLITRLWDMYFSL